jgi:hypothetical protein
MSGTHARLDRRSLVVGLGSATIGAPTVALASSIGSPTAAPATDADEALLGLEDRLGEILARRREIDAARAVAERAYCAARRERPSRIAAPARSSLSEAAYPGGCAAAWAAAEAALRRRTGLDTLGARLEALDREAAALVAAILACPAATPAGLAAKARLFRRTGDERLARSLVDDLLRTAELVNTG